MKQSKHEVSGIFFFSIFTFSTSGLLVSEILSRYFTIFTFTVVSFPVAFLVTLPLDILVWKKRAGIDAWLNTLGSRYTRRVDKSPSWSEVRRDKKMVISFIVFITGYTLLMTFLVILKAPQHLFIFLIGLVAFLVVSCVVVKRRLLRKAPLPPGTCAVCGSPIVPDDQGEYVRCSNPGCNFSKTQVDGNPSCHCSRCEGKRTRGEPIWGKHFGPVRRVDFEEGDGEEGDC